MARPFKWAAGHPSSPPFSAPAWKPITSPGFGSSMQHNAKPHELRHSQVLLRFVSTNDASCGVAWPSPHYSCCLPHTTARFAMVGVGPSFPAWATVSNVQNEEWKWHRESTVYRNKATRQGRPKQYEAKGQALSRTIATIYQRPPMSCTNPVADCGQMKQFCHSGTRRHWHQTNSNSRNMGKNTLPNEGNHGQRLQLCTCWGESRPSKLSWPKVSRRHKHLGGEGRRVADPEVPCEDHFEQSPWKPPCCHTKHQWHWG